MGTRDMESEVKEEGQVAADAADVVCLHGGELFSQSTSRDIGWKRYW